MLSLLAKYKSNDVMNTPPTSSIKNVCANGSTQPIVLSLARVDVLVIDLVSVVLSLTSCGSLVEIIVFCTVSKIPLAT